MGAAYYEYISGAHRERVIMLHSGGTRCEVSQLQRSWHAVSRVHISRGADAAPARLVSVRLTTLSHHCTRAYDVVVCEGDARAAE